MNSLSVLKDENVRQGTDLAGDQLSRVTAALRLSVSQLKEETPGIGV